MEVSGKDPRGLSNVRPVRFRGFDDSTRREQWNWTGIWERRSFAVAHVVLRKWELLLSRSDLKALGATIDPKIDSLHFENQRTTLKLSTAPAGHNVIDLLNQHGEVAPVDSLTAIPGSIVKVLAKGGDTSQVFSVERAVALRPASSCLNFFSDQRLQGEIVRHGLQFGMCLSPPF